MNFARIGLVTISFLIFVFVSTFTFDFDWLRSSKIICAQNVNKTSDKDAPYAKTRDYIPRGERDRKSKNKSAESNQTDESIIIKKEGDKIIIE